jgi:phosphoribosyl 1,2-cyclic phosphodiesterase
LFYNLIRENIVDMAVSMGLNLNSNKLWQTTLRINGVMPDVGKFIDKGTSERAIEVSRISAPTNTSCSIISSIPESPTDFFHLVVDVGHGVVKSLLSIPNSGPYNENSSNLPDGLLLTHSHDDHVKELPDLLNLYDDSKRLKIYCTRETYEHLINRFDSTKLTSLAQFIEIKPGENISIGPLTVTAIAVEHYDYNSSSPLPGCVIYVINLPERKKIVIGWDFLSINNVDNNLLWNPDVLILGTETYNHHPESGMISVTEAFDFVRRWNAKECYILHYSGLMDFEDGKNQWFRGPAKAMTSTELQNTINNQLKLNGSDGKFKIIVADEGMTWSSNTRETRESEKVMELQIGKSIEIESLQNYIFELHKLDDDEDKLHLVIEDRINRYSLEFINTHLDKYNDNMLYGEPVKGMLARGPELKMEIISESQEVSLVRVNIMKGNKCMFKDDILINSMDSIKLIKFIRKNFRSV